MQQAHKLAAEASAKQGVKNQAFYNRKVNATSIEVYDSVLVRKTHFDGKHKLADRWESEPYTVMEIPNPDIPVYKVRREDDTGPIRTLHRNLLLPIAIFPSTSPTSISKKGAQNPKRITRSKSKPMDTSDIRQ